MHNLSGEKFELRLVRADEIMHHEDFETERSLRLARRFKCEKVLYNPLILGRHKKRYILIDGANRFHALKKMSCNIILAQIVDYLDPDIILKSWYHFIADLKMDVVIKYLRKHKIKFEKTSYNSKPSKINEIMIRDKDFDAIAVKFSRTARELLIQIREFYKYFKPHYTYYRINSDSDISDLNNVSSSDGVLIIYPEFSKENILNISTINYKLPAGITRHLIPNRVLHIKYPIDKLKSHEGLDKKNSALLKFIVHKIENKKVRLYKEPILIFDEY